MSIEKYRLWIVVLLAIFVVSFIVIGFRFSANGRYVQYDTSSGFHKHVIDTQTGEKITLE